MTTNDIIISAIGIAGIWGCVAMQFAAAWIERRPRLLATGSAERLLDGERFVPPAADDYEGDPP